MHDINGLLLILQASSLTMTLGLALLIFFAWFHQPDTSHEYEQMRWCIIAALLLLTIHYFLQIHFGFRAQGADVGALVNTLFYPPAIYIFSYSFVRLASRRSFQRRFILVASVSMLLIIGCFIGGYLYYDSLHMPMALYAMGACFCASIVFCFVYPTKEIRRMQQLAEDESGQMQIQFNLFLKTGSTLLYAASGSEVADEGGKSVLSESQIEMVRTLLEHWRQKQGFASSEINSITLAARLNIPKRILVQYLREVEGKTFRVWLSDLRLDEAKQLILTHPDYSNEAIAEACGFSRSHLQVKFKESTGLTTNDWRDAHTQQS